jgi:hypothetical protein
MRNKHPGTCYRCGDYVGIGEGHFEKRRGPTKWALQHAECAIKFYGTEVGRTEPQQPRPNP